MTSTTDPTALPARQRRDELRDTLAVLVASVFLLAAFTSLFEGTRWFVVVLSVLLPTAAVTLLVRLWAPSWATFGAALAALVAIVWVFAPGTTVFGAPTPASAGALADLVGAARVVILEEASPLRPPDSVILLVAAAMTVTFVLADAVARQSWRVPLLGLLWTTLLVVPSVIAAQMPPWWAFAGAAAAWLWLWWSQGSAHRLPGGHGNRSAGAAATIAVVGLTAAVVLPAVAPRIEPVSNSTPVGASTVFGSGINPMIQLGSDLRQSDSRRVLTYRTDSSTGVYLKAATLWQFTGRTWTPSRSPSDVDVDDVSALDPSIETKTVTTRVAIEGLRTTFLPVPYPATVIRGLQGTWRWQRDGSTVRGVQGATSAGQTYTVTSVERLPTAEQLRATDRPGTDFDVYRELPPNVPPIVSDLAERKAGGESSDYDRMLVLQNWMRDEFTYSTQAPVEYGYDGNGLGVMGEFLTRESGYCVHFASTLAVMGRVLGVPTRVAVGYAPSTDVIDRGQDTTTYAVDSDRLHAWTEAYFEGVGWLPFDATPGIGEATEFAEPAADSATATPPTATNDVRDQNDQTLNREDDATIAADDAGSTGAGWRAAALVVLTVILLGAGPAVIRSVRRRRRLADGTAEPLWAELTDTARDLGVETRVAETPRVIALRLTEHGADPDALGVVVGAVECERYSAGSSGVDVRDEARRTVASLEAASSRRDRWRARLLPKSLLRG